MLSILRRYILFSRFKRNSKNLYGYFFFCLSIIILLQWILYGYLFLFLPILIYSLVIYEHSYWNCIARRWECNDLHILNDLENVESSRSIFTLGCSSALENSRNKEDIRFFYLNEKWLNLLIEKSAIYFYKPRILSEIVFRQTKYNIVNMKIEENFLN